VRIGRLRHRVMLEQVTRTADGQGGWTEAWGTLATVWAGVEPLRGVERYEAQKINAKISHKVVIRALTGVTAAQRVKFGDRYLTVEGVININEKNQTMEMYCSEET
jgi:SPP1 family predicted phage head-tail adaptor